MIHIRAKLAKNTCIVVYVTVFRPVQSRVVTCYHLKQFVMNQAMIGQGTRQTALCGIGSAANLLHEVYNSLAHLAS